MAETKQEKVKTKKSTEQLKAERLSDATDDEVLKAEETRPQGSKEDSNRTPSPDGAFEKKEETDKAGPM